MSIDKSTLPSYCKAFQMQPIILSALQAFELISNVSAEEIEPESQKEMAILIQDTLEKCLFIDPFTEIRNIAIWVAIVAVPLLVLSTLVLDSIAFFVAMSLVVLAAILIVPTALYVVEAIRSLVNTVSALNQADTVYKELANVVETVCLEIASKVESSPTVPDKAAKQVSFSEARDQLFSGKNCEIYTLAAQQTAPANSPEQSTAEEERAPTMAFKS